MISIYYSGYSVRFRDSLKEIIIKIFRNDKYLLFGFTGYTTYTIWRIRVYM